MKNDEYVYINPWQISTETNTISFYCYPEHLPIEILIAEMKYYANLMFKKSEELNEY